MKCRFSLIVSGAVLILAIPGWGDAVPYARVANGSAETAHQTKSPGIPGSGVNAPANASPAASSLPAALPSDPVPVGRLLNAAQGNAANLSEPGPIEFASSDSHQGATLWSDEAVLRHAIVDPARHPDRGLHHHSELVSEPSTLPLILIGSFALGLLSSRRIRALNTT